MILAVFGYITVGVLSVITGNNIVRNCLHDYDSIREIPDDSGENNNKNNNENNNENNNFTLNDLTKMEAEEKEKKALYVIQEEPEPEIEQEEEEKNINGYSKIFFFPFLGSPDRYVPDCE